MVTSQFDSKSVPYELQLGSDDLTLCEDNLVKTFFSLRRWLELPPDTKVLTEDTSLPATWVVGNIVELPKDRKYQHCLFKLQNMLDVRALELEEAYYLPERSIVL